MTGTIELLTDDKHRYAAAILAMGFQNNVEYALIEAERWENGEFHTLVSNWPDYYLLYNTSWNRPFVVKKQRGNSLDTSKDTNIERFRW